MIGPLDAADAVAGQPALPLLEQFLERALVVFGRLLHLIEGILEEPRRHRVRHAEPRVNVHRAEHGFHDVGEHRGTDPPPGFFLTLPEEDVAAEIQPLRDTRQVRLADDAGAQFGQFALWRIRVSLVQMVADDEVQHGIPQQLKPLVALAPTAPAFLAEGAVLQGEVQQGLVPQAHVELLLQGRQLRFAFGSQAGLCGGGGGGFRNRHTF